jgi:hypothetical protein
VPQRNFDKKSVEGGTLIRMADLIDSIVAYTHRRRFFSTASTRSGHLPQA